MSVNNLTKQQIRRQNRIEKKEARDKKKADKKNAKLEKQEDKNTLKDQQKLTKKYNKDKSIFDDHMALQISTLDQLSKWDTNEDGKVCKEDLPPEMQTIFHKLDGCAGEEKDGALSFEELHKFNSLADANCDNAVSDYEKDFAIARLLYSDNPFEKLPDYDFDKIEHKEFFEKIIKNAKKVPDLVDIAKKIIKTF